MICQVVQGKVFYDYNYRVLPPVRSRVQEASRETQESLDQESQPSLPQSLISWFLPSSTEADVDRKSPEYAIDYYDEADDRYKIDNFF